MKAIVNYLLPLLLCICAVPAHAQTLAYTSDSLCHFSVPKTLKLSCDKAECRFVVTAFCNENVNGANLFTNSSIQVFNRWGQEIYKTELKDQAGWNGGASKEGVYFWILTFYESQGGEPVKKTATGSLTIMQ